MLTEASKTSDMQDIFGRIRDVDMHEMIPARLWVEEYGAFAKPVADMFMKQATTIPNALSVLDEDQDQVTSDKVASSWGEACRAVGAYDMPRRLEVMDTVGIRDSLLFGSAMSIAGQEFASGAPGLAAMQFNSSDSSLDLQALGRAMLAAHNAWCLRTAALSDRLRPVGQLLCHDLAGAVAEARRLIDGGLRALSLSTGEPIEGKAPCHPDNDVLWKLFADNDVALVLHIGGEKPFLRDPASWINCPQFYANQTVPTELNIDPFSMATCHLAAQNFLANMVLGGVFERIPNLRCGFMELGANWVGPTAQNMDLWVDQFPRRFATQLSLRPSEYVRRNVRVSPFSFEPVDTYFEQFPFLRDVLCFATDYPHYEGGKDPINLMLDRVSPLGREVVEKFFVTNADFVMP